MFNWLGNLFPYSDLHSLNLDWILNKMKETATQAAKAIADSATALSQVIEAKTAAQNAQTAAQNAQTAANNAQTAANNAADSAENAVNVAQTAQTAAQTAQSTAETAQSAAQTAQSTAQTAQNTANEAKTGLSDLNAKFPIKTDDISNNAVTTAKIGASAITTDKIAASAVTGNKISDDVVFGFQFDKNSALASVASTNTPVTVNAPTSNGRRAAFLSIETTVSGYRITSPLLISLDLNTSVVYMIPFSVIEETTMAVTEYIAKYSLNTLTIYKPGVTQAEDLVIPLNLKVITNKCVKTV